MQPKGNAKRSSCQDPSETSEQREIRLLKKRLQKAQRIGFSYLKASESCRDQAAVWRKKAEEYKQLYFKALYDNLERVDEANKRMLLRFERKLLEHGLVKGKPKIESPCDNCKVNGNCKFQDAYKTTDWRRLTRLPCFGLGPIPPEGEEKSKISVFTYELVDQSTTDELHN